MSIDEPSAGLERPGARPQTCGKQTLAQGKHPSISRPVASLGPEPGIRLSSIVSTSRGLRCPAGRRYGNRYRPPLRDPVDARRHNGAGGASMKDSQINVFYSDEDGGSIADIPDLESCSAFGRTPRGGGCRSGEGEGGVAAFGSRRGEADPRASVQARGRRTLTSGASAIRADPDTKAGIAGVGEGHRRQPLSRARSRVRRSAPR